MKCGDSHRLFETGHVLSNSVYIKAVCLLKQCYAPNYAIVMIVPVRTMNRLDAALLGVTSGTRAPALQASTTYEGLPPDTCSRIYPHVYTDPNDGRQHAMLSMICVD